MQYTFNMCISYECMHMYNIILCLYACMYVCMYVLYVCTVGPSEATADRVRFPLPASLHHDPPAEGPDERRLASSYPIREGVRKEGRKILSMDSITYTCMQREKDVRREKGRRGNKSRLDGIYVGLYTYS